MKSGSFGIRLYYTVAVPVLLTLICVRIVMSPLFLHVEYTRIGFPPDYYGFTTEERLLYGKKMIDYLVYNRDESFIADLAFDDGSPLFSRGEVRHMEDVKVVTRIAYFVLFSLSIITAIITYGLLRRPQWHNDLQDGVFQGALLTLIVILSIIALAVFAWNTFFDSFHALLFEAGTWRFAYSDTLIRLFPEQFWLDSALVVGGITAISALILIFLTRKSSRFNGFGSHQ
jgi:integral membrane protein (TIGR01906 family)